MAAIHHGFCDVHRIGYNRQLDPTCPQCTVGRMGGAKQWAFDTASQKPIADDGKTLLDPLTLAPTGQTLV